MIEPSAWQWLVLACFLFALEILAPGTYLLWLGIAALLTSALKYFIPDLSFGIQLIVFASLSIISLFSWIKYFKNNHHNDEQTVVLNQRQKQYIGKTFRLNKAIKNGVGEIVVDDTHWKVKGKDTPQGEEVKVIDVEGNLLLVEKP